MQGGLAQTSIALSTLMSGVTGSSIADAAMNARILGPQMLKRGFSRGYAAGVLSYGSLMAPIIPPGIGFILYGTVGQVSIGRLFAAGIIPGLMLWASLAIAISITARKRGYAPERDKAPTVQGDRAWPPGAASGRSCSRSSCCSACASASSRRRRSAPSRSIYAVVIGMFAYRMLTLRSFIEARGRQPDRYRRSDVPARALGIFGYGIVFERIPEVISNGCSASPTARILVMVLIVLFILLAGTFMEGSVLIIMLTPIFLPLVTNTASTRCISAWSSSSPRPSAITPRPSAPRCSSSARC